MKKIFSKKLLSALLSMLLSVAVLASAVVPAFAFDGTETTEPGSMDVEASTDNGTTNVDPAPAPAPDTDEIIPDEPAPLDLDVFARTLSVGDDSVSIVYAVPFNDGAEIRMMFWTEEQTEYTPENAAFIKDASYTDDVLGTKAQIFYFDELEDKQMTDAVYARAFIKNDEGYVFGALNKYSVLNYASNMKDYTEIDETLDADLDALLDRGAEAQIEAEYKTDDLANETHSRVYAVGEVMSDGFAEFFIPAEDELPEMDRYMITTNGATFYIEFDVYITGYQIIEDYLYYFEDEVGAKKSIIYDSHEFDIRGRVIADFEFVIIMDLTYYFIDQKVSYGYQLIDGFVYYFGLDGVMVINIIIDGFSFGVDGKLMGSEIFVDTGEYVYYLVDSIVIYIYIYIDGELFLQLGDDLIPTVDYESNIVESDGDQDAENNEKLANVECIAKNEELGISFTVMSDENGNFNFPLLPRIRIIFIFIIEGYVTGEIEIDLSDETAVLLPSIVLDKNVSNTLTGKITIADSDTNFGNNASLGGVAISLERISSLNPLIFNTITDANGNYSLEGLTAGIYRLIAELEGYVLIEQIVSVQANQNVVQNAVIEAVPDTGDTEGFASGILTDARTGYPIVGVKVVIRAGLNQSTGEILMTLVTDGSGAFCTEGLLPGNYTAQVIDDRELTNEDERFGSILIALKVLGGITVSNQNATSSNNIGLDLDGMRVVLTWGSDPRDLDSHMEASVDGGFYHVYYGNKTQKGIMLDVDDTSGYGPETTTVSTIYDGIYKFYVHKYSGVGTLSTSGAKVEIYFGSNVPAYTLYVPEGNGYNWDVFTYNSITGEFTIINTIR